MAAPSAQAAGADGSYRLTRVSGTFVANGQTIDIPNQILTNALLKNGRIVVTDNKIPIYRTKWQTLLDEFNYLGFSGTVQVSGPSNLVLNPVDGAFVGSTTKPVKLSLSGDYNGTPISLLMKMNFRAKVIGNTMTATIPITLTAMGVVDMKGTVKIVAKR